MSTGWWLLVLFVGHCWCKLEPYKDLRDENGNPLPIREKTPLDNALDAMKELFVKSSEELSKCASQMADVTGLSADLMGAKDKGMDVDMQIDILKELSFTVQSKCTLELEKVSRTYKGFQEGLKLFKMDLESLRPEMEKKLKEKQESKPTSSPDEL